MGGGGGCDISQPSQPLPTGWTSALVAALALLCTLLLQTDAGPMSLANQQRLSKVGLGGVGVGLCLLKVVVVLRYFWCFHPENFGGKMNQPILTHHIFF